MKVKLSKPVILAIAVVQGFIAGMFAVLMLSYLISSTLPVEIIVLGGAAVVIVTFLCLGVLGGFLRRIKRNEQT